MKKSIFPEVDTPPPPPMKDGTRFPFSSKERKIMNLILKAHSEFNSLKRQHPNEMVDWVNGVHALQNILGWRVLRRDYPNEFPIKK